MLCENCKKLRVCRYKDRCQELGNASKLEPKDRVIFSVDVTCKEFEKAEGVRAM